MQAVFAKILNMSITGSIVIAVVLLARLTLKRAPKIYSYLFQVNAPFEDTSDAANVYVAAFDFDSEGNFIAAYLQVNPVRDDAYTLTQSIITTDPQVIATKLDFETIRATK